MPGLHMRARLTIAIVLLALTSACAVRPPADARLYAELGEQAGIEALVDGLIERITRNPRIAHRFEFSDLDNLHLRLSEQICEVSGGPCTYGGEPMDLAHAGQDIRPHEFNALVEDLQDAMQAQGLPFPVQNRLLALLAPMQRDIVGQ